MLKVKRGRSGKELSSLGGISLFAWGPFYYRVTIALLTLCSSTAYLFGRHVEQLIKAYAHGTLGLVTVQGTHTSWV